MLRKGPTSLLEVGPFVYSLRGTGNKLPVPHETFFSNVILFHTRSSDHIHFIILLVM